jgi:hypothetical protein
MLRRNGAAVSDRNSASLFVSILLLSVVCQTNLQAQDVLSNAKFERSLSASAKRVIFDSGAFTGQSTPLPQWDKSYLVSHEIETYQSGVVNVRLYDRSGARVREAAIWFPGSQRVLVYSAAATSDGRIIAGGKAEKPDGTAAPFIALTDLAGKVTNVIQTQGFFPVNICQAPDGSVWSFGSTGFDENSQPKPGDTLRHFDLQKGEVGSFLPRSTFPKHPAPEIKAYIRCTDDGVIAYSAKTHQYIEMKYADDSPSLYRTSSDLPLVGFAVIGSKDVYGYFSRAGNGGLYYLSVDEAAKTATWHAVKGAVGIHTAPGVVVGLWGSDGENLVVSRAEDSAGNTALHWAVPLNK